MPECKKNDRSVAPAPGRKILAPTTELLCQRALAQAIAPLALAPAKADAPAPETADASAGHVQNAETEASRKRPLEAQEPEKSKEKGTAKSDAKIRRKFRDMCKPKPDSGRLEVPEDVFERYTNGGVSREDLFKCFSEADGIKDSVMSLIPTVCQSLIKPADLPNVLL